MIPQIEQLFIIPQSILIYLILFFGEIFISFFVYDSSIRLEKIVRFEIIPWFFSISIILVIVLVTFLWWEYTETYFPVTFLALVQQIAPLFYLPFLPERLIKHEREAMRTHCLDEKLFF